MSPCINVCKLDKDKMCIGCFRTIHEIAQWSQMTNEQKKIVVEQLEKRKNDYMGTSRKQS